MNRITVIFLAAIMSFVHLHGQISPAPAVYTCEVNVFAEAFEGGIPAGWEVNTDNYTGPLRIFGGTLEGWFIQSGTTATAGTGPTAAFEGSTYAYCEGSGPIARADTATLRSPVIALPDNPGLALSFYTNLFGPPGPTGSLSVYVVNGSNKTQLLAPVPGNTHPSASSWEQVYLDLSAYAGQSVQLLFQGVKPPAGAVDVDLAIDQIEICSGVAVTVPSMSTWGVIILMFLMMIVVSVAVRPENNRKLLV